MTQTLIDPRMFDTSQALGAHDASSLTNVPAGLTLVQHQSITTDTATMDFTDMSAQMHFLQVWNLKCAAAGTPSLQFLASTDNGSTFLSGTNYAYARESIGSSSGSHGTGNSNGTSNMQLSGTGGFTQDYGGSHLQMWINRDSQGSTEATVSWILNHRGASEIAIHGTGSGTVYSLSSNDVDAIRIQFSTGNIAEAEASLFSVAT